MAIISVGAGTEADMKQKKARVEDALHATRAAVEEGILPGGGVALLRCREAVEKVRSRPRATRRSASTSCCTRSSAPMQQIADNCGIDGSVVADEVSQKPTNIGYDANTGEYVDMFKAGIIDPVKVVRSALSNAASIAGLMLTTEALVTNARQGRQGQAPRRGERPLSGRRRMSSCIRIDGPLPACGRWPVSSRAAERRAGLPGQSPVWLHTAAATGDL